MKVGCSICCKVLENNKLLSIPLVNDRVQAAFNAIVAVGNSKIMFVGDREIFEMTSSFGVYGLVMREISS